MRSSFLKDAAHPLMSLTGEAAIREGVTALTTRVDQSSYPLGRYFKGFDLRGTGPIFLRFWSASDASCECSRKKTLTDIWAFPAINGTTRPPIRQHRAVARVG